MSGELCELRNRDLYFSLAESHDLLANFGAEVADAELALLHQRSEGWAAALADGGAVTVQHQRAGPGGADA